MSGNRSKRCGFILYNRGQFVLASFLQTWGLNGNIAIIPLLKNRYGSGGPRRRIALFVGKIGRMVGLPLIALVVTSGAMPHRSDTPFADLKSGKCFTRADLPKALSMQYDDIVRRIHTEVWRSQNGFQKGDTVQAIGKRLGIIVQQAAVYGHVNDEISLSLFRAETVVAWVRSNVSYWTELNSRPGKERVEWNAPQKVLSHSPNPKGNCDGYCRLTQALAAEVGLTAFSVGGAFRGADGNIGAQSDTKKVQGVPWNHGWTAFAIGNKLTVADTASAWKFVEPRFRLGWKGKADSAHAIPLTNEEWEIFLGGHRALMFNGQGIEQDPFTSCSLQKWLQLSVAHLKELSVRLRNSDTARNNRLGSL